MPRAGRPEKTRVSRVSVSWAWARACRYAGPMPDSGHARKAVPICTACAPSACAAAMPRPSMMPPAAITGMSTASTHCGTSARVPTWLAVKSPRNVPRWPPASVPLAHTASAPTRAQARASATVVAVPTTRQPAACRRATWAASKMPKVKLATAGRRATSTSNWAAKSSHHCVGRWGCRPSSAYSGARRSIAACTVASSGLGVACTNRFMPKGRSVCWRTAAAASAMAAGERMPQPSMPSPPAADTAAARAGVSEPVMGPWMMGNAMPRRWRSEEVMGRLFLKGGRGQGDEIQAAVGCCVPCSAASSASSAGDW